MAGCLPHFSKVTDKYIMGLIKFALYPSVLATVSQAILPSHSLNLHCIHQFHGRESSNFGILIH